MKKISILFTLCVMVFANDLDFMSLKSDFIQTVTSGKTKIIYKGSLSAIDDNKAVWNYIEPTNKTIYFGYDKVMIVEPDLEQVIVSSLKDSPNLTKILKSAKKVSADEYQALHDGITYKVKFQNSLPSVITYKDKLDNFVEIKLSNTQKDISIDRNDFIPNIPDNYDIVKN
ncbi:outer membrane lipoprotein chaperone LolA [Campylobacter sp. RM12327]|uniref:LolA-like outer membrane lipoprotein chaperone n=1 Tax=Campylobacter sputorum TaxID=206 RepID=UPI000B786FB6|nr:MULTISPECIES: LolA-like outer membrane lipoprotein chaperone [Campylobacter]ASM40044.1 outer membrane lipoprotein carrier protein [Campylobacter sputorum]MBE7358197.1 outer membrane lipoprotein chaperone LolA [Campylobacter sp. RM11302]MBF6669451.1 outer membrane lipoprotein chaperone LolA [Campylobacter sp. RM12327]MBF6674456.1 outer membrane lipoprotein chaperone LolA [Campylobacter sp. RM13538]MBF6676471.1 outer membrane lipoprotein chaperone LolA [Campylobacter sp. RM12321]